MSFFFIQKSVKWCHISIGLLAMQTLYFYNVFFLLIEQCFINTFESILKLFQSFWNALLNPFVPNSPFLYPLKISENLNKLLLCCFLVIFTCEALHSEDYSTPSSGLHIQEFVVGICRWNLPQEFVLAICCGLFIFVSKSFLVYASNSCLYGSKLFLYVSKTFYLWDFLY